MIELVNLQEKLLKSNVTEMDLRTLEPLNSQVAEMWMKLSINEQKEIWYRLFESPYREFRTPEEIAFRKFLEKKTFFFSFRFLQPFLIERNSRILCLCSVFK